MPHPLLEPLPYEDWKATKNTLHLMCQIVGKIRLAYVPHRSHWWNITLLPSARGLSTQRMRLHDTFFEIAFDFIDHRVTVHSSTAHEPSSIELVEGLSVAAFYRALLTALHDHNLEPRIIDKPYGVPFETPFSEDTGHAAYDRVMVRRWWQALVWSADVMDQYAVEFSGKQSPAQLFWHSFDLALARYSGRPAGGPEKSDFVQQEAYSHEVIAAGFWPGDEKTPAPTYYTYTAPEPADLIEQKLEPAQAAWYPSGAGHMGALPYETVRNSADPRAVLLAFLRSGYRAGIQSAHWDAEPLRSAFDARGYRADA